MSTTQTAAIRGRSCPLAAAARRRPPSCVTHLAVGLLAGGLLASATQPAAAADATWLGTSGTLWSTAGNWTAPPTSADRLVWVNNNFSNAASFNDIVSGTFQQLRFINIPQSVTLSGQPITLTNPLGNTMLVTSTGGPLKVVTLNLGITFTTGNQFVAGGGTKIVVNGTLAGAQPLAASGTVELNAANTFNATMRIGSSDVTYPAPAEVSINSLAGTGTAQSLGAGTLVTFGYAQAGNLSYTGTAAATTNKQFQFAVATNGSFAGSFNNNGSGTVTWTGAQSTIAGTNALTFSLGGSNAGDNAWQSAIKNNTGAGGVISFTKKDAGRWILSGSSTYTGSTSITGGTLEIGSAGSINSSSRITINGTGSQLKYNSATPLTAPITFTQGTISGTGTIATAVTVGANDVISPGNSPGIQSYTQGLTWDSGGTYVWEVNNWTGSAGTAHDQIAVSGSALNVAASSGSPFTIRITGLTGTNTVGTVPGFDNTARRAFTIATSGSLANFAADKFTLDWSGSFSAANPLNNGGFTIGSSGNNVVLTYVPSAVSSLAASASGTSIRVNDSATLTATITSSTASVTDPDSLAYTGLSLGGAGGLTSTSGTLAGGASGFGTVSYTGTVAGPVSFMPAIASGSNVSLGTPANAGAVSGVTVTVFNAAQAGSISGTNFGTVLKGTPLVQAISLTNTAPAGVYSEKLDASFGSLSGVTTNSGTVGLLPAGSTSTAMSVYLSSGNAGLVSGTAQVNLWSNGQGSSGLSPLALTSQAVTLTATVLDPALASFTSGSTTTSFLVDFGTVNQNAGVSPLGFSLWNLVQTAGYTADLALYEIDLTQALDPQITVTATSTFMNLAAGSSNPYSASFTTVTPGSFQNIYTFRLKSANDGTVYSGDAPQSLSLTVQGTVVVPEPASMAIAVIGILTACGGARYRRRTVSVGLRGL